ncbi:hypothetical protein CIG75_09110 [Tumebacillus algifaecis]|uniref:Uncharacterized protein n=1 Tax=Tumebacillus algifaecis TaxID=1214604 RepID=A0A223D0P6_9BACL|nr:hypothetical protein [Tumebacillus algifaecis]ASS75121.1 hypothetical protein CIG75_09110 [Tumebacillus algifaecis]
MRKKPTRITNVYLINVEEPDDYYYKPEGVLFLDEQGHFTLFTADSRHNFLRAAVQKFPYKELEESVIYRNHQVQLNDVTLQYEERFDLHVDDMLPILHAIYNGSPRQFFFLEPFFLPGNSYNHFVQ